MKKIALLLSLIGLLVLASAPTYADNNTCYQPARLVPGANGRVSPHPNIPNRLRSNPSLTNNVIGRIPAGASFFVYSGPVCSEGMNWYHVNYNSQIGWVAEGNGFNAYWLEYAPTHPNPHPPTPVVCALSPRLVVGGQGQVTPGLPNVLRSEPGTVNTGAVNSRIIGEIPAGGTFAVLNGPQCGTDGRWWWLVNYNGLQGWTAEGEGNTYWLVPIGVSQPQCPNFLPSRLQPGRTGAVTTIPYLPNRIRVQPNTGATVLGQIPAGGIFHVISGPYCNQNTAWWHVSYGNVIGWTAEGNGSTYWLEPR